LSGLFNVASSLESRLGWFYAIPVQGSGNGFHDVAEEILPRDALPSFSPQEPGASCDLKVNASQGKQLKTA
jgi:hypothetical protein